MGRSNILHSGKSFVGKLELLKFRSSTLNTVRWPNFERSGEEVDQEHLNFSKSYKEGFIFFLIIFSYIFLILFFGKLELLKFCSSALNTVCGPTLNSLVNKLIKNIWTSQRVSKRGLSFYLYNYLDSYLYFSSRTF